MARRKRSPEENARRAKIRELLQQENVSSMNDMDMVYLVCPDVRIPLPNRIQSA